MATALRQIFNSNVLAFILSCVLFMLLPQLAFAQGFDKINTTVTNINTILVTISIAVVTPPCQYDLLHLPLRNQ